MKQLIVGNLKGFIATVSALALMTMGSSLMAATMLFTAPAYHYRQIIYYLNDIQNLFKQCHLVNK